MGLISAMYAFNIQISNCIKEKKLNNVSYPAARESGWVYKKWWEPRDFKTVCSGKNGNGREI